MIGRNVNKPEHIRTRFHVEVLRAVRKMVGDDYPVALKMPIGQGIDTEGNPIPGLYVLGNDSGCYFANTYPNLSTGMACGRIVTFSRYVGKHLANM